MRLLLCVILAAFTVGAAATQPTTNPTVTPVVKPGLIGVINYADGGMKQEVGKGWKTDLNPYGFNPEIVKELDLRDPKSFVQFQINYGKFSLDSFDRGDRIGVEGYLLWDCEGGEYGDGTTYVGDPTLVPPCVGRSMIRYLVAEAKARHKKIGFTFRDKNFTVTPYGAYQAVGDSSAILRQKMQRARYLYGDIQLAYLDDVCDPVTNKPPSLEVIKKVASAPNWTMFLEFGSPDLNPLENVRSLRFQQMFDSANGKRGDLGPRVSAREILVPFDGEPSLTQLAQWKRETLNGAFAFVCITWDRPDTKWVPKFFAPKP